MKRLLNHPKAADWILRLTIIITLSMLAAAAVHEYKSQTVSTQNHIFNTINEEP